MKRHNLEVEQVASNRVVVHIDKSTSIEINADADGYTVERLQDGELETLYSENWKG